MFHYSINFVLYFKWMHINKAYWPLIALCHFQLNIMDITFCHFPSLLVDYHTEALICVVKFLEVKITIFTGHVYMVVRECCAIAIR